MRLPRVVHLGNGYRIRVVLASQDTIKDVVDEDGDDEYSGAFDNTIGEAPRGFAGTIFIYSRLSRGKKWETYWHELQHAVTDIAAWDREHPVVI